MLTAIADGKFGAMMNVSLTNEVRVTRSSETLVPKLIIIIQRGQ